MSGNESRRFPLFCLLVVLLLLRVEGVTRVIARVDKDVHLKTTYQAKVLAGAGRHAQTKDQRNPTYFSLPSTYVRAEETTELSPRLARVIEQRDASQQTSLTRNELPPTLKDILRQDNSQDDSPQEDASLEDKPTEEASTPVNPVNPHNKLDGPNQTLERNFTDASAPSDPFVNVTLPQLGNNSAPDNREALAGFSLSTADPLSLDPDFQSAPVFKDSSLVGAWNSCFVDASAGNLKRKSCLVEPEYADRISFSFQMKDMDLAYEIVSPQLVAKAFSSEKNVSSGPEILDFAINRKSSSGSFTVVYHCKNGDAGTTLLELTLPVVRSFNISLRWLKDCRSGPSKYLEFGYVTASGLRQKFGESPVIVPATLSVTEVYVMVKAPAISQEFDAAMVSSSDENVVTASTRGSVGKGLSSIQDPATIAVMFACHTNGKANITLKVPVPPWDDLETTFEKDCGGSAASISVGSSLGKDDVVARGITTPTFFSTVADASNGSRRSEMPILSSTRETVFVIQHSGAADENAVHFSNAIVTIGDTKLLRISLKGFLSGADKFSQEDGMLYPGDAKKLALHFVCLSSGTTWVLVTLPLMRYKSVEFGFSKDCTGPSVHKESTMFNVRGALDLLLIVLVVVTMGICFFWRVSRNSHAGRDEIAAKYSLVDDQSVRVSFR
jgi:hypothetical protein